MKTLKRIYAEFICKAKNAGYSEDELVLGEGVPNGILIIGEAPGRDEVAAGRPFVGKAGRILDGILLKSGLSREELFVTNTVKFRPFKLSEKGTASNRPPTPAEISFCAECLADEIEAVNPELIITLGNIPLKAVTQESRITIGEWHGMLTNIKGRRLFAMYHPASVIYNRKLEFVFEDDIKKLASIV